MTWRADTRVNTMAPGVIDAAMLGRLREDIRQGLADSVPHPKRCGSADINGETVRRDGSSRMASR